MNLKESILKQLNSDPEFLLFTVEDVYSELQDIYGSLNLATAFSEGFDQTRNVVDVEIKDLRSSKVKAKTANFIDLEIQQNSNLLNNLGTTGSVLWKSAYVLLSFLIGLEFSNQIDILELGSGTGVVGIGLTKILIKKKFENFRLILSDQDDLIGLIKSNVERNLELKRKNKIQVLVEVLDWSNIPKLVKHSNYHFFSSFHQGFDLIIGSDLIYNEHIIPILVEAIVSLLKKKGIFILAQEIRAFHVMETFLLNCEENGLCLIRVKTEMIRDDIVIYLLTLKDV